MHLLHGFLTASAAATPDKPFVIFAKKSHSFREIDEKSDILACEFQRLGARRGDRIAAMLDNSPEMVIALWATLKAGCVFIPVSPGFKAEKLAFLLSDSGAVCLLAQSHLRSLVKDAVGQAGYNGALLWAGDKLEEGAVSLSAILAQPHTKPADPQLIDADLCLIIYTSGSTGKPKGVMMTHRAICNNVWSISTYLRNTPDDIVLCVLPLSFDYGLFQILTAARVGFTVLLERSFAFPFDVLKRIGEYRVTGFPGVPTMFAALLQFAPFANLDLSSLRYFSNTAAAFPAAHIQKLRELLPHVDIYSMYGLTECTRVAYLEPERLAQKIMSVGRAMPNTEVYIVGEDGKRCAPRQVGELVIRGTSLMRGYWKRPDATAKALRDGENEGEKILYSGDLFWMDEEGDLFFVGRRDDVFKCRGEKVSPREVEACLFELPGVAEAAVVGVAHDSDGFAIKAHVVPRPGMELTEDMLRKHCRTRLEPLLVPRFFEISDQLPKTDSGKIVTAALRKAG